MGYTYDPNRENISDKVKTFTEVPIVDIQGLYSDNLEDRQKVADKLGEAAREVGFLYIKGHNIDQSVIDGVIECAKTFHAQPLKEKMEYYIGKSVSHKGYVPTGEEGVDVTQISPDQKESFDVGYEVSADHPLALAKNPMVGPNRWPEIPGFEEKVRKYYSSVMDLGRLLCRGLALALGIDERHFDPVTTTPPSQLRLLHYPYNPSAKDAPGIGIHTDYELMTMLLATAPGLEVMNDKGVWVDAPPVPGAFVLNIGDCLEIMTAGEFPSTAHRVRSVEEERYSFPFFFATDYYTKVEPLPEYAEKYPERAAKYSPVYMGDHILDQTINTFKYLKKRVADGVIDGPKTNLGLSNFGYLKRLSEPEPAMS